MDMGPRLSLPAAILARGGSDLGSSGYYGLFT